MFKLLLKKQLFEVFRSYFYNPKTNKSRSKGGVIGWFIFFGFLMIGIIGGTFTSIAYAMCTGIADAGFGWLYFFIFGCIAVVVGAFGSVFNTYSSLYLGKDNDLLLSMPIDERVIIASRLVNVYLLGVLYSFFVFVPALFIYWIVASCSVLIVVCGIIDYLIITLIILILSCLLGYVVARISLKVKRKSLITVILALILIGGYYFIYFKASELITDLILNVDQYGNNIIQKAYVLYIIGRVGEGDVFATLICLVAILGISGLTWVILAKSFVNVATSSGKQKDASGKQEKSGAKGIFRAILEKELRRFASSANYMLNCGLGILLVPIAGVLLLVKGNDVVNIIVSEYSEFASSISIIICAVLFTLASTIDVAAPSISLEGKSFWIYQSLPVDPKVVLLAKATVHIILSAVPVLFTSICATIIVPGDVGVKVLLIVLPLIYVIFSAFLDLFLGLKMANLNWSNELIPIKQGGAVVISLFGGWGVAAIFAVVYILFATAIGPLIYMAIFTAIFLVITIILIRFFLDKGSKDFSELTV